MASLEPGSEKMISLTKTGSGQGEEKLKKEHRFVRTKATNLAGFTLTTIKAETAQLCCDACKNASSTDCSFWSWSKRTPFLLPHFRLILDYVLKMIILPRQARDERNCRENSMKRLWQMVVEEGHVSSSRRTLGVQWLRATRRAPV